MKPPKIKREDYNTEEEYYNAKYEALKNEIDQDNADDCGWILRILEMKKYKANPIFYDRMLDLLSVLTKRILQTAKQNLIQATKNLEETKKGRGQIQNLSDMISTRNDQEVSAPIVQQVSFDELTEIAFNISTQDALAKKAKNALLRAQKKHGKIQHFIFSISAKGQITFYLPER